MHHFIYLVTKATFIGYTTAEFLTREPKKRSKDYIK